MKECLDNLKHLVVNSPLELIRKNPKDISLPRRKELISFSNALRLTNEVSSVAFGTKPHRKTFVSFKKMRDRSSGYAQLHNRFSKQNKNFIIFCWRSNGKTFCTFNKPIEFVSDSLRTEDVLLEIGNNKREELTRSLIVSRDLGKELNLNVSRNDIIKKLTTFKIDKCGKYINITKELLSNFNFLRIGYSMTKNKKGVHTETVYDISDK